MRKTAKRVVSILCALCMFLTTCGTLTFAEVTTADEVKGLIDALILADVNLDNWDAHEADVDAADAKRAELVDDEKTNFEAMETDDGVLYNTILNEMVLVIETGPVYDAIMSLPEDRYDLGTGEWLEGINKDNYQQYYDAIVELGVEMDALTTDQQRLLGETVLARYSTAAEELSFYWFDYVFTVVSALVNVYESNVEWDSKTDVAKLADYQTKRAQYEKAQEKVEALVVRDNDLYKPDQLDDVNTALEIEENIEKTAQEILDDANAHITGIYNSSMGAIVAVKEEIDGLLPITVENCVEINTKAIEGLANYAILKDAIGNNYWDELKDDALEAALIDYRDTSAEWIDAAAFANVVSGLSADIAEGITKENYTALASKYTEALERYEGLSDDEKTLDPTVEAKAELDNIGAMLSTFADEWVEEVEAAIDAIPQFDHATYLDAAAWEEVVAAIAAARQAYDEITTLAGDLAATVTGVTALTDAEAKKATILDDYTKANAVIRKIDDLGDVSGLATDDIVLYSREEIEAAKAAYAALTIVQQSLVSNYDKLLTADAECTTLEEKKAEIEGYIASFNTHKDLITYTSVDQTDVDEANSAYEAAIAIADDTDTYGSKLAALVTELKTNKATLDAFIAAIEDLQTKGDALVAAVEDICAQVDIKDEENLEGRLIAYAISADAIEEMNALFGAAGEAYTAYNSAKADSELLYGEVPVAEVPYSTYKENQGYYEVASAIWFSINPTEQVAAVDEWVEAVNTLFDEIDDVCQEDLEVANGRYEALADEYDSFELVARNYLYSNYLAVLSKFDYIRIRIAQYEAAANIIETANNVVVPELPAEYDGIAVLLDAYIEGVSAYETELVAASEAITTAYNTYNDSDLATKEIAGVNEAYEALQEKESECANRNIALAFDKKVISAAKSFVAEDVTNHATYAEIVELKDELAGIADEAIACVTSEALLSDVEVDAVEDLIAAIGSFDINTIIADRNAVTDKIDAARDAYDILTDEQKEKVENYQTLLDAETLLAQIDDAIAFIDAVNALEVVDANNWEIVKEEADNLKAVYDAFDAVTQGMVTNAYNALQKKQAEVVSFMLSMLPDIATIRNYIIPDDMPMIDEVIALLYAIDHTDADGVEGGAYRELTAYAKLRVVGYAKYGVTVEELKSLLAEYNQLKASVVIEAIDAIGYYDENDTITMTFRNYTDYLDAIEVAEEAYAAYKAEIDGYQETFGSLASITLPYLVTNTTTMEDARADYNKFAAAEERAVAVQEMLDTFYATYPTVDAVTRDNYKDVKDEVVAIQDAYDELDSLAKKFVEEAVEGLAVYMDQAYAVERYMAVVEAIDALLYDEDGEETSIYTAIVEGGAFDPEYGLQISDIEKQYEELTAEEKVEVTNYAVLETARESYDANVEAAIATTIEKIDAIFAIAQLEDFAVTNGALEVAIDEANDWFNSLAEEAQARVTNADKLVAANEKIASLTNPDDVIDAIDELGDPEEIEITDENYEEITAAVEAARELYDSLVQEDKLVVDNYTVLVVWEDKVAAFEPDRSGDVDDDGVVSVMDIAAMVDCVLRRVTFDDVQFERANLVIDEGEQVIDIFDILRAIELIEF